MNVKNLYSLTDSELVDLMKIDNKNAFTVIYNRYWEKLYLLAYTILKDNHAAEDIVQEVMVSFWLRRNITKVYNLNSYLYQSTRFQVFKLIRKGKNMQMSSLENVEVIDPHLTENNLHLEDIYKSLLYLVEKLPARCKEIFLLRRMEGMSIKEISIKLKISQKTVENQLTIALKKVRTSINENTNDQILLFVLFVFLY